ncbi:uncharacterized protein SCHCODRAFT_02554968 [Schizophyllum commune H4-8]|nr:uncharacterized protein SCHCODRAFT_02554968 [Schizophyllum commune H4-8]KAI5887323.1 hypothetical protein SCHCODRAFT_02554968 [Schizophyllum commune H4-8]
MASTATQASTPPTTLGDAVASGERILREMTITLQDVVPPHVNSSDRNVKHFYVQASPTYLLGYLMTPRILYEIDKRNGKAEATMKATLDKFLAYVKGRGGITWGHGLERRSLGGEERWLFWMLRSECKEDIYTAKFELVEGFRRLLGAGADPALIIYKHPKHYIC